MAIGDIGASVEGTLTLDATGSAPSICHVYGDVFACAYDDGANGRIKTFSVDSSGNISAVISSLAFAPGAGVGISSIILAHPGMLAVAYGGSTGWCKTVPVDNSGNLGAVKDSLNFETTNCIPRAQSLLHVSGNVFAYAYQGGAAATYLTVKTWTIDTAGNLGSVVSTLSVAVEQNKGIAFVHLTGNLYATLINQLVHPTQLDTFTISDAGTISAVIDTAAFDTGGNGSKPQIVPIGGNNYAFAYYRGFDFGPYLIETRSISPAGVISAQIDLAINQTPATPYSMLSIGCGVYAYACIVGGVASVRTISIAADGTIGSEIDDLSILASPSQWPHIIHHQGDIYAVSLTGPPTNDGLVKSLSIVSRAPANKAYSLG